MLGRPLLVAGLPTGSSGLGGDEESDRHAQPGAQGARASLRDRPVRGRSEKGPRGIPRPGDKNRAPIFSFPAFPRVTRALFFCFPAFPRALGHYLFVLLHFRGR